MTPWLISLPLAYLLGSIPFGYLLVRTFLHQDIRATGSGNTGATNVAREAKSLGILTLVLDLLKAVAAVLLAERIAAHFGRANLFDFGVLAAVFAILGHCFPVWLGFRGGKGVASALGVFLALVPRATIGILLVFLVVLALTRYVSLASMLAAASFPFFGFYFVRHPSPVVLFGFLFIPILIIVMHRANIGRLVARREPRMGQKKVTA